MNKQQMVWPVSTALVMAFVFTIGFAQAGVNGMSVTYVEFTTLDESRGIIGSFAYVQSDEVWVETIDGTRTVYIEEGRDEWSVYLYGPEPDVRVYIDLFEEIIVEQADDDEPVERYAIAMDTVRADDIVEQPPIASVGNREVRTAFPRSLEYVTSDNFAVWWDPAASAEMVDNVPLLLEDLERAWNIGVGQLGMPGPEGRDRYLANVYLGGSGPLLQDNGAAVGTDADGFPFMILPANMIEEYEEERELVGSYAYHEAWHLFQYAPDDRFPYGDDSDWYIESTANWFAMYMNPTNAFTPHVVYAVGLNPQLPLWATHMNQVSPPEELSHARQNQHYGNFHFLRYLEAIYGVDLIIAQWTQPEDKLPQQLLFERVQAAGGNLQRDFANYAARNATWDYPNHELLMEWMEIGATDPFYGAGDDNRWVATLGAQGTNGAWQTPPSDLLPAGYGYNVVRLDTEEWGGTFKLAFDGSAQATDGTAAHFGVTAVTWTDDNRLYNPVVLDADHRGEVTILAPPDSDVFLVVAATPVHFSGNEVFPYEYQISRIAD